MTKNIQLPGIMIGEEDFETLSDLIGNMRGAANATREFLARELDRADVRPLSDIPLNTVVMNAKVTFEDVTNGKTQTVTLVYPHEADIGQGRISVLTPVGAALLGLSAGQVIDWASYGGGRRQLTVHAVEHNPRQP